MSTKAIRKALALLDMPEDAALVAEALAEVEAIEKAARALDKENISDLVYRVRDRVVGETEFTGNTWEHPRVVAYGEAAQVITNIAKETKQS